MKILLAMQGIRDYEDRDMFNISLGMPYICGSLVAQGFDVSCINVQFSKYPEMDLINKIRKEKIDVVLCGGLSVELNRINDVFNICRKANQNIITIVGGGGVTSEPIIFSKLLNVDYGVVGEGEKITGNLLRALEKHQAVKDLKGIVYKENGEYHQTEHEDIIDNPDEIPFPIYEGFSIDEYLDNQKVTGWYHCFAYFNDNPRIMPMLLARSCPYTCSFCFHPLGNKYRYRSLDNFFEELELLIDKYHINCITLLDECFSVNEKRVIEFCKRIKKYNIVWACQMRADNFTDKIISNMKDAHCIAAYFGIESASETVLQNMNKKIKLEDIEKAFEYTYKYKIGSSGSLIFGAETETLETVKESLNWYTQHTKEHCSTPIRQFGYIESYPGCTYYSNAVKNGKILDRYQYIKNGNYIINITQMSDSEYEIIGKIAKLKQSEIISLGKVIAIEHQKNNSFFDITIICPYCGSIVKYRNIENIFLEKGHIRKLGCRKCHVLNDYILNDNNVLVQKYYLVDWLLLMEKYNYNLFFNKIAENKILIVGKSIVAKLLFEQLQKNVSKEFVLYKKIKDKTEKDTVIIFTDPINYKYDLSNNSDLIKGKVYSIEDVVIASIERKC